MTGKYFCLKCFHKRNHRLKIRLPLCRKKKLDIPPTDLPSNAHKTLREPLKEAEISACTLCVPADHLERPRYQHLVAPLAVQRDGPVVDHLFTTRPHRSVSPSATFPGWCSADTPTCWLLLRRCPGCSVCSTWIRTYSWSVRSTIPPAKGPPTWSFSRALSRKSVRFIAVKRGRWGKKRHRLNSFSSVFFGGGGVYFCDRKLFLILVRASFGDAAGKDTETVRGGDGQHRPGVVSVRIHAEEQLKPQNNLQVKIHSVTVTHGAKNLKICFCFVDFHWVLSPFTFHLYYFTIMTR